MHGAARFGRATFRQLRLTALEKRWCKLAAFLPNSQWRILRGRHLASRTSLALHPDCSFAMKDSCRLRQSIRRWKFKPVTKDGEAIPVIATVIFDFVLGNEDEGITPEVASATVFPAACQCLGHCDAGTMVSKINW
jgi:hypothetical protein